MTTTLARSHSSVSNRSGGTGGPGHTSASQSPPAHSRNSSAPPSGHASQIGVRRHSHSHASDSRHPHGHKHEQYLTPPIEVTDRSRSHSHSHSPSHSHSHSRSHSHSDSHHPRRASHARSHSHSPPSISVSHTTATAISGKRAPRAPLLHRSSFAPDFTSATHPHCGCKTGAEAAAHGCWGHEPPITPTIPDCQLTSEACHPHGGHGHQSQSQQAQQLVTMPVHVDTPMPMPMPVSMPLYPQRPHPHSIAGPLTHTPAPIFGWPSVTPRVHGYGQPKYARFVKPDYRRFCYSVGKADVPYFPFDQYGGSGMYGGTGMGPTGPISGWGGEVNPNLHRSMGSWVA